MRGRTERLRLGVYLPDSICAVGVAGGAAKNVSPEHEPLHFFATGFENALITNLCIYDGHFGGGELASQSLAELCSAGSSDRRGRFAACQNPERQDLRPSRVNCCWGE